MKVKMKSVEAKCLESNAKHKKSWENYCIGKDQY